MRESESRNVDVRNTLLTAVLLFLFLFYVLFFVVGERTEKMPTLLDEYKVPVFFSKRNNLFHCLPKDHQMTSSCLLVAPARSGNTYAIHIYPFFSFFSHSNTNLLFNSEIYIYIHFYISMSLQQLGTHKEKNHSSSSIWQNETKLQLVENWERKKRNWCFFLWCSIKLETQKKWL